MALNAGLSALTRHRCGAFRKSEARAAGYTEHAIRRRCETGEWSVVRQGVYADRDLVSSLDEAGRSELAVEGMALSLTTTAVSHGSAARRYGMTTLRRTTARADLTWTQRRLYVFHSDGAMKVHTGLLPGDQVIRIGGVAVTTPARTVLDIARDFDVVDGVVAGDSALALGLTDRAELERVVATMTRWPWVTNARRAIACLDARAQNPLESLFHLVWSDAGLSRPELQAWLYDADGFIGIVDGAWLDPVAVYETDGAVKYTEFGEPSTLLDEKRRQERIERAGVVMRRYDWDDGWRHPVQATVRMKQGLLDARSRRPPRVRIYVGDRDHPAPDPAASPEALRAPESIGLKLAYDGLT